MRSKRMCKIVPPEKWLKTQITRLCLYFLGMGIETAYKNVPQAKRKWIRCRINFHFALTSSTVRR